ncbi:cytochrome P450 [Sphingopyxis sp. 22461]|uniref:cytochrome P450 n=1 Tax=Sphingopyxis sp. 22461 TaxID=3453923 RepID=UPI003F878568
MLKVADHVPANAIVTYDYFDQPGFKEDPHAVIMRLFEGRTPRIFYTPLNGGHWVIGGYQELFDATRDTQTFSSTSMQIPAMSDEPLLVPLNMDPPDHAVYRAALNKAFTPARIVRMEDGVRKLADELIDQIAGTDRTEFVSAVAEPLPVFVFMEIAGIPREHFRAFRDNVFTFLSDPDATKRSEALGFFHRELGALITQKRAAPQDDLLSQLVTSDVNGRPISDEELMGFCILLMLAGLDTVTNAMSLGVRHLAADQALQARLRADASLIPAAVEELLRRYAFASMGRIVMRDTEFHGLAMRKGDRVLFVPAAAGLDPAVYNDPLTVELNRKEKGVPTFGFGPHRCVGMHLARLELRVLYEQWLSRIPAFSLSPASPPRFHGGIVIGLETLNIEWATGLGAR